MSSSASWTTSTTLLCFLFSLIRRSYAHDHHTASDPSGPLDAMIILHIGVQFFVWCILFPVGLIYGFTRYRGLERSPRPIFLLIY